MGVQETGDGKGLAQVEVYEIAKDGELIAVSETVTQQGDLCTPLGNHIKTSAPTPMSRTETVTFKQILLRHCSQRSEASP
ncbi:hypothetical protein LSAT2_020129 [Lamellibrachia satsuma]|nr:hypothetical protein LSAT2_020129 [Lamellibrachia satsuma]